MSYKKILSTSIIILSATLLSSCLQNINTTEFKLREVGELMRAEQGQVITQHDVVISSWQPINTGYGNYYSSKTKKSGKKKRGITYLVKMDRTGETLSITQSDDVFIQNGAQVWVQFGERTRILPK